jgi:hypothetical protein
MGSTSYCSFWRRVIGGAFRALPCAVAPLRMTSVVVIERVPVAVLRARANVAEALLPGAAGGAWQSCATGAGVKGNPGGNKSLSLPLQSADPPAGGGIGANTLKAPSKLHDINGDRRSASWCFFLTVFQKEVRGSL